MRRRRIVINIAEKPSVAKKITQILSNNRYSSVSSQSRFNPIYTFPYTLHNVSYFFKFTSVTGHLYSLDFPIKYRKWNYITPIQLIQQTQVIKFVSNKNTNINNNIQNISRNAEMLILWLDCDLEGENISYEVIDCVRKVNGNINVMRAKFSEITQRAINNAIRSLGRPNIKESEAVDVRREIDLRIGAAFTRLQTLRLKGFDLPKNNNGKTLLSFGTCQFPTLGFIVDRYLERRGFVKENFWKIDIRIIIDGKSCSFWWQRNKLFDHPASLVIYELVLEDGIAHVTNIKSYRKNRLKPMPLNTVELQKLGTSHLKLSGKQIMDIAEKLYNDGIISYPRTETNKYKLNEKEIKDIVNVQTKNSQWGKYANDLLNAGKYSPPRNGMSDDGAHPPIHPVKSIEPNELRNHNSRRVYELICKHFLASLSKNAIGQETSITIKIAEEFFHSKGLMIVERNYLDIHPFDRWTNKDIPIFQQGKKYECESIILNQCSTFPPPLLTERDLISKMDQNGIGTDATIAQHIKTIQDRCYCKKVGIHFEPTKLGLSLVEGYSNMKLVQITKPELRKKVELDMKNVARGTARKDDVLNENLNLYKKVFEEVEKNINVLLESVGRNFSSVSMTAVIEKRNFSTCGTCRNMMDLKKNGDERFLECPNCKISHNLPIKGNLAAFNFRCLFCNFQILEVTNTENGKTHKLCPYCFSHPPVDIEESKYAGFRCFSCTNSNCQFGKEKKELIGYCFGCNAPMYMRKWKDSYLVGCSKYPACGCSFWLPKTIVDLKLSNPCTNCSNRNKRVFKVISQKDDGNNQRSSFEICLFCSTNLYNYGINKTFGKTNNNNRNNNSGSNWNNRNNNNNNNRSYYNGNNNNNNNNWNNNNNNRYNRNNNNSSRKKSYSKAYPNSKNYPKKKKRKYNKRN